MKLLVFKTIFLGENLVDRFSIQQTDNTQQTGIISPSTDIYQEEQEEKKQEENKKKEQGRRAKKKEGEEEKKRNNNNNVQQEQRGGDRRDGEGQAERKRKKTIKGTCL